MLADIVPTRYVQGLKEWVPATNDSSTIIIEITEVVPVLALVCVFTARSYEFALSGQTSTSFFPFCAAHSLGAQPLLQFPFPSFEDSSCLLLRTLLLFC
eukprot:9480635-Pyramimonas_sp.AAC.5